MRKLDYLIVGQGLAGSALAWDLVQRGNSVVVFDEPGLNRSSAISAGLFNPITGRVMTKTWQADILFPYLNKFYARAEAVTKRRFFHPLPIYRPFLSAEEMRQWKKKSLSEEVKSFLLAFHDAPSFVDQVHNDFGGIEIAQSGYLNVTSWVTAVRDHLIALNSYKGEQFDESQLVVDEDVRYQDLIATRIIFCNGVCSLQSKWFQWLPLKPLKGETLQVRISMGRDKIFSRGVFLVPSTNEKIYTVGSTYVHPPFSEGPTQAGRDDMSLKLQVLVRPSFEIVHQDWGIRPTTPDRRPILGAHPANKNVIIFNGLGTKGVSLAPYFAHQLADWLEGKGDMLTEVNINRFKALYSG